MSEISSAIRLVERSEHDRVLQLWEDSVRASHDFITETDINDYRHMIAISLDGMELFCIERAGRIQGFIALLDHKVMLLFVHPTAFRQGLGKRLILFAIQQRQAWLVDVNAQNKNAVSFYFSLGFKVYQKYPADGAGKPYPVWSLRLNKTRHNRNAGKDWKNIFSSIFKF